MFKTELFINDQAEQAEALDWLERVLPASVGTVVFIGGGLGHVIEALAQRHPSARAVVLEPDADVARALSARPDWTTWASAGRLAVLTGPDYAGVAQVARQFGDLATAPVIVQPRLEATRPEAVATAKGALARLAFQSSANDGARRASAGRYLLQTLANAPRLAHEADVGVLASLFSGMPAVIVAAGPSLDRNIDDLAAVAGQVVIIACDTAAKPLVWAGIDPHFVVATDSSRANATHLSSLLTTRSWLVAEGSLHPSAFVHFAQRTFVFRVADHEPWPWLTSHGLQASHLDTWGSVATCAFSLALHLGCSQVGFIGADFAFTDGRPYCRGTSFEPQWAVWRQRGSSDADIWNLLIDRWPATNAVDLHGAHTRTAPHLVSFRDWVVEQTGRHTSCRFVNATGAGLLAGPRITQATLTSTFGAHDTIDRNLTDRVLNAAHQSARGDVRRVLAGVTSLFRGADSDAIDRWVEFAGGSVPASAIEMALQSPDHVAWTLGQDAGAQ
ncbi:MAG: 6-hydroxymethylpterin diphosphokinase MptE-like protein [Acidobacteriota bacterium]